MDGAAKKMSFRAELQAESRNLWAFCVGRVGGSASPRLCGLFGRVGDLRVFVSSCLRRGRVSGGAALDRHSAGGELATAATGRPNSCFTESRTSTMMVKTPRTVPTGMKMHSTPAITRQKVYRWRF